MHLFGNFNVKSNDKNSFLQMVGFLCDIRVIKPTEISLFSVCTVNLCFMRLQIPYL